jgi:hypothetical protein
MRYICNILDMKLLTKKKIINNMDFKPPLGGLGVKSRRTREGISKKGCPFETASSVFYGY